MCNFANENEKDRKHHLDADGGHDTVSTAGRQQEVVGMGEGCEAHPQPLPKGGESYNYVYQDDGCHDGGEAQRIWL